MTNIRLTTMRIRNFKGIRELDIHFNGNDVDIYGDNGTGKTTIIDSFTWLLFGKDSLGRADFGIKPTDKAGNIVHQLETSVEAVFYISGTEKVFKKTLEEVWTRKRGAAEAEFTRNENSFYIDGVPKKKMEYTTAIKELIDEEVFKIITNPLYFNESVKWQDRRSVLLTICGEISDNDVIAANEALAPLLPLLQGKTVSDFKDIASATMKQINRELDMIPVKISEAELAKPSTEALEVDQTRKDELTHEIESLRVQKSSIEIGAGTIQKRQELSMLRNALAAVGTGFQPGATPEAAAVAQLNSKISDAEFRLGNMERRLSMLTSAIEHQKATRVGYSKDWDNVFAERFTDSVCPTCHRELPEDEIEERRKEFNRTKAQKLDEIEKANEAIGADIEAMEKEAKELTDGIATYRETIRQLTDAIEKAKGAVAAMVAAKEQEFAQERQRIADEISKVEGIIRDYTGNTQGAVAEIDGKIASLSAELSRINTAIANKALLERQDKRIAELKAQQTHLAAEYNIAERNLYLAEQFIVAKVNMLNERINKKFRYAKFKLFEQQLNGGINEVCEVTYGGIPYKDLNNAMRINIGLDVINTIAAHYGVTCPIMIDNAESVNEVFHTEAQQIRFYVSHDKSLLFTAKEE